MKHPRKHFWRQVAMGIDTLNISLLQDETVTLEAGEREYTALLKTFLGQAQTPWQRRHLRRLIAHATLTFAHFKAKTWTQYERALSRVQRLGYLNEDYQSRAAHFTLLWIAETDPSHAHIGWELVAEAERRLLRLRRGNPMRKQSRDTLAAVRQRVIRMGLPPPRPPGTAKRPPHPRGGHPWPPPAPPTA